MKWKQPGARFLVRGPARGGKNEVYGIFEQRAQAELVLHHARDELGADAVIEEITLREAQLRHPPADRRAALIEATIEAIAEKGYSSLTLSDVASRAGISTAHVFTSFESKQQLLRETLLRMNEADLALTASYLARAGNDPARQIAAVAEADLCDAHTDMRILRAWIAFRSEARELYEEVCRQSHIDDMALLTSAFAALTPGRSEENAYLVRGLLDGLLRMILVGDITREKGRTMAADLLHQLAPAHFAA